MQSPRAIALINVVSQLGAGRIANGPAWLKRVDYLKDYLQNAGVGISQMLTICAHNDCAPGSACLRYLDEVIHVCMQVHQVVFECLKQGITPIIVGGDHSVAIGSVSAVARYLRESRKEPGLLWADAHIDMNTPETTPSGNIHGMALAALCGLGDGRLVNLGINGPVVNPARVVALGLRFADVSELPNVYAAGLAPITMRAIDRTGLTEIITETLPRVLGGTGGFHFSFDLDVLDPSVAPGVNTPFPGGLNFREAHQLCDRIAATGGMISMDVVEHNPETGPDEIMLPVIGELIASCLGASCMP
jgi:arginase